VRGIQKDPEGSPQNDAKKNKHLLSCITFFSKALGKRPPSTISSPAFALGPHLCWHQQSHELALSLMALPGPGDRSGLKYLPDIASRNQRGR
jgi:hypothetical protein